MSTPSTEKKFRGEERNLISQKKKKENLDINPGRNKRHSGGPLP